MIPPARKVEAPPAMNRRSLRGLLMLMERFVLGVEDVGGDEGDLGDVFGNDVAGRVPISLAKR